MNGWQGSLLGVSCLGFAVGCRPPNPEAEAANSQWHEVTTQHFVFETDLGESSIDALADQVENARHVMIQMAFGRPPPPGPKIRVIALPYREFKHFEGGDIVGLFVTGAWFEPVLITGTSNERDSPALDLITHELGHAVVSQFIPAEHQPRWFAEGIASYLETVRTVRGNDHAYVGIRPAQFVGATSANLLDMNALWAWGSPKTDPQGEPLLQLYFTSWTTLHYLVDERPKQLEAFESALARGEDPKSAYRRVFPDLAGGAFRPVLSEYLKRFRYSPNVGVKKAEIPRFAPQLHPRALSSADARALRASLYLALAGNGGRSADDDRRHAKTLLAQSKKLDPVDFWAQLVDSFYFDHVPTSPEPARRAVAQHPDEWLAWFWYARVLQATNGSVKAQRNALDHAAALAPGTPAILERQAQLDQNATPAPEAQPTPSPAPPEPM